MSHPLTRLRKKAVPLVFFETSDPAATISECRDAIGTDMPQLQFDCVRSMAYLNTAGQQWLASNGPEQGFTFQPPDWLQKLGDKSNIESSKGIVFWHNPDWSDRFITQGMWNLRDPFSYTGWTMVCLGASASIPPSLRMDFIVVPETLPDMEGMVEIVCETIQTAKAASPSFKASDVQVDRTARALLGLNRFAANQGLALALNAEGVDIEQCWKRKLDTVKSSQGCELSIKNPMFKDVAGLRNAVQFFGSVINGRRPPGIVCRADEIEKAISGFGSDTSGVTTKQVGTLLTWMQERNVDAALLTGVPGAGKSLISRAIAGEAGVVFADISLSGTQSSLVGSSEANLRAVLNIIDTIGQGNVLWLSTCNDMTILPPELVARHKLATFFFEFPDEEEAEALWKYYIAKYELKDSRPANTRNWVGREVESCCYKAWMLNLSLEQARMTILPQCVSQKSRLDAIRNNASGRYLSASYQGPFDVNRSAVTTGTRKLDL